VASVSVLFPDAWWLAKKTGSSATVCSNGFTLLGLGDQMVVSYLADQMPISGITAKIRVLKC
jgi:hypothetical protein